MTRTILHIFVYPGTDVSLCLHLIFIAHIRISLDRCPITPLEYQLENCPRWRIEASPTAHRTETLTLTRPYILSNGAVEVWHQVHFDLWPWLLKFHLDLWPSPSIPGELWSWPIHVQKVKVKDHSVQKLRVETDGRTDGSDCITSRANAVDRLIYPVSW